MFHLQAGVHFQEVELPRIVVALGNTLFWFARFDTTALKRLTEAEEAQESGQLAAAVEKLTGGDQA